MLRSDVAKILRAEPLRPFEQMATPPNFFRAADRTIESGWKLGKAEPVFLDDRNDWAVQGRSHSFHLHAWDPIDPLLASYSSRNDPLYLEKALPFARSWLNKFQQEILSIEPTVSLSERDGMAWYDMSVGQRVYRLAYLMDASLRSGFLSDEDLDLMARSVFFHMQLLSIDDFFIEHNNHGLYQALGQAAVVKRLGRVPEFYQFIEQAEERLALMVDKSFFHSGAHTEHSPGYHRMILHALRAAIEAEIVSAGETRQIILNAIEVEKWMTKPDGRLVGFGDTDPIVITKFPPTENGMVALADAGYVFSRFGPSYFAQSCGFHSRTHKHADHLTFVWNEGGNDILIDPGRYGYEGKTTLGSELNLQGHYYSDPNRIYVEATRAHNCVEIDGQDYLRRGVQPFGSALESASATGNLVTTLCQVRHSGQIRHFRMIFWKPGDFLIAVDWLKDGQDIKHDFRQWFQLGPDWQPSRHDDNLSAKHPSGLDLQAESFLPTPKLSEIHVGQKEPKMSGWISTAPLVLEPSPSLCWELTDTNSAVFATIFSLSTELKILKDRSNVSENLTTGNLCWITEAGERSLQFTRFTDTQHVDVTFTASAT